jgi:hypothetical protein
LQGKVTAYSIFLPVMPLMLIPETYPSALDI